MKHKLFTLLLAMIASVGTMFAETYSGSCGEDLTWSLNTEDSVLTIRGTGAMADYQNATQCPWNGYSSLIQSVIMNDDVTTVSNYAFAFCSNLKNVSLNQTLTTIGEHAFFSCPLLESVVIPDNVIVIGYNAFAQCSWLTSVRIGNKVTTIGKDAFARCGRLSSVVMFNSVTSIGENAFDNCSALTTINIPNSITSIRKETFAFCAAFTSIEIPESVTSIGENAFYGCSGLTSVTNKAVSPQTINANVFTNINFSSCILYVPAESVEAYKAADVWKDFGNILPIEDTPEPCITASGTCGAEGDNLTWTLSCDSVLTISGTGAMADYEVSSNKTPWYSYRESIKSIVIEDDVTSIGNDAFFDCIGLTSIEIPNSVTSIGDCAFAQCFNLSSVTIGNNVAYIGTAAFGGCSFTTLDIPASVQSIGDWALESSELSKITVAENNSNYCAIDGVLYNKDTTLIIRYPQAKLDTTYAIPRSVTSIGRYAIRGSVHLTSMDIPNSLVSIQLQAFQYCANLMSVKIPESITTIENYAFRRCNSLTSVTNYSISPQTINSNVFENINLSACTLYVPAESVEAYKTAEVWKDFGTILPIEEDTRVLSIAEAINVGMALNSMATSVDTYTIEGYVINAGAFYTGSKDQSWYMADDAEATSSDFQAYRCYPIDGTDTVEVQNGSKVRMTGKLQKYYNRSTGKYIVEMTYTPAIILSTPVQPLLDTITVAEALAIGATLADNAATAKQYVIRGYVSSVSPYVEQYGYQNFYIADEPNSTANSNAAGGFYVYRGIPSTGTAVTVGNLVELTCAVRKYVSVSGTITYIENSENPIPVTVLQVDTMPCIIASGTCGAEGDNLTWTLTCDSVLTISGTGKMADYEWNEAPWFSNAANIVSVEISEGITSIGDYAFNYCSKISSVSIPSGVTSIGFGAFTQCSVLTSVNMPNTLISIGESAFVGDTCLTSITIPSSVTYIGNWAFENHASKVTSIICEAVNPPVLAAAAYSEPAVFLGIDKSIPLYVPAESIELYRTAAGWKEFGNIVAIEGTGEVEVDTITVAQALEIGATLEENASTAKQYVIRGYVSSVSPYVEQYGYQNFYIADEPNSTANSNATGGFYVYRGIPSTGTAVTVGNLVELTCAVRKYVSVSGTITYIENSENPIPVTVLQVDTMPCVIASGTCGAEGDNLTWTLTCDSVLTISGTGAMADYNINNPAPWYSYVLSVKTVVVNEGVPSIGMCAFMDCSVLTSIIIPNSVISIGDGAFSGCSGLTSIKIPDSVTSIGVNAFCACYSLASIEIPNSVTSIGFGAFQVCYGLTSVTIPNSVTSIGEYAFGACYSLASIVIPNSVTYIAPGAFARCTSLNSINVANDNTNYISIEGVLFAIKTKNILKQYPAGKQGAYTIPNNVTSIGSRAFEGSSGLTSVIIPNGVTNIGTRAFYGCSSLTSVTNYATTPQQIESDVFGGTSELGFVDKSACTLYVPAQSLELYQSAEVWKDFGTILPIEGTETPIETVEGNYTIYYEDKDSQNLTNEVVTLHVPVAPVIEGFTFVEWRVVEGSLSLGITIQAVYEASELTSAPEVYTNPANHAQKLIRNGNVYILTDDKVYTITGQKAQ